MSAYQSANPRNSMAVTSLVAAVIGWLVGLATCCAFFIPFLSYCTGAVFLIGNIVAAVTGFMARRQIQETGGSQQDEQWANIGMILGIIGTILGLGLLCFMIFGFFGLAFLDPNFGNSFPGFATPTP